MSNYGSIVSLIMTGARKQFQTNVNEELAIRLILIHYLGNLTSALLILQEIRGGYSIVSHMIDVIASGTVLVIKIHYNLLTSIPR